MLLQKRVSWILLTLFFIFDNVISYYGIKYLGGREGNFLIASVVGRYPILYFFCIPLTLLIMFIIVKILKLVAIRLLKKWKFKEKLIERVILGATVIYWVVANSLWNVMFLLDYRLPVDIFNNVCWPVSIILGLSLGLIYAFFMLNRYNSQYDFR